MKFRLIGLFIALVSIQVWCDPLLVTVLMVKNEAKVIEATLQPFVDGGLKHFVIFDTGSTDGTQEVAADFFRKNNISDAYIIKGKFIDFATSRNQALSAAEVLFPEATFMLMPDAEWYTKNVPGLVQFCQEHKDDDIPSFLVLIRSDTLAFHTNRLLRCRKGIKFVGAVHEVLNTSSRVTLPDDVYFEWRPGQDGVKKSHIRWQRDRDLLLKSYQENPHDPRTVFYLAQTYECLGDMENAYTYYQKRQQTEGWDEENFVTLYRLGRVAHALELQKSQMPHASPVLHYLDAFSYRPGRGEALIKIAEYYLSKGDMHLAFLFALRSVQLPYPSKDILFVEKYMYDYTRYDVLGICAWYIGEYELGEWAVRQALKIKPDAPHLLGNLKLYMERKGKCS